MLDRLLPFGRIQRQGAPVLARPAPAVWASSAAGGAHTCWTDSRRIPKEITWGHRCWLERLPPFGLLTRLGAPMLAGHPSVVGPNQHHLIIYIHNCAYKYKAVCIYTHLCNMYLDIYIYIYIHIYIHIYSYIYTPVCIYTHLCVYIHSLRVYRHTCVYIHACVYIYAHLCVYTHTRVYIYIHVYIYIYSPGLWPRAC